MVYGLTISGLTNTGDTGRKNVLRSGRMEGSPAKGSARWFTFVKFRLMLKGCELAEAKWLELIWPVNIPAAARITVLPLPNTSYPMPSRGAKLLLSNLMKPLGTPGSPSHTIPIGAVGNRVDCSPGRICERFRMGLYQGV